MILLHGTKNHMMKNNMNRNVIKAVTITSWLFTVLNIILQFTGVIPRDWGNISLWTTLSIIWVIIWVDDLTKDNNKDNG